MEIKETDYILGIWFAEDKNGNNFIMLVKRDKNTPKEWIGEYRFRYKVDDKIFDSDDKKSFYEFSIIDLTEKEVLAKIESFFESIKIVYSFKNEYVEIKGDVQKFMFRAAQAEWMNLKRLSKEEAEK